MSDATPISDASGESGSVAKRHIAAVSDNRRERRRAAFHQGSAHKAVQRLDRDSARWRRDERFMKQYAGKLCVPTSRGRLKQPGQNGAVPIIDVVEIPQVACRLCDDR